MGNFPGGARILEKTQRGVNLGSKTQISCCDTFYCIFMWQYFSNIEPQIFSPKNKKTSFPLTFIFSAGIVWIFPLSGHFHCCWYVQWTATNFQLHFELNTSILLFTNLLIFIKVLLITVLMPNKTWKVWKSQDYANFVFPSVAVWAKCSHRKFLSYQCGFKSHSCLWQKKMQLYLPLFMS